MTNSETSFHPGLSEASEAQNTPASPLQGESLLAKYARKGEHAGHEDHEGVPGCACGCQEKR